MAAGEYLGGLLGERCVAALGIAPGEAESYGKAALVGVDGELEHGAAILHPRMGAPLRKVVEKGAALIPSSKKRGGPGQVLDVPLGHKDAAYVRSHFDGMEVQVSDAPRAGENHGRHRGYRQRPSATARRRPPQGRDHGRGRPALNRGRREEQDGDIRVQRDEEGEPWPRHRRPTSWWSATSG